MKASDLFYIAASGVAIAILIVAILLLIIFLFTAGSPLLIIGIVAGLGIWGLFLLAVLAIALISVWYVVYAYIKSHTTQKKEEEKGEYTLERLKKA